MRGVIKAHDARAVRPIEVVHMAPSVAIPAPAPESPIALRLAEVEAEAVRLQASLSDLEAERRLDAQRAEEAQKAAHARGLQEGREAADRDEASRLKALEATLDQIGERLERRFADLDDLAVAIAYKALADLFTDPVQQGALVIDALRRQLEALKAETVVSVTVSARDFSDADSLASIADVVRARNLAVQASDGLTAGECLVSLELGQVEIGPAQQWRRLQAQFREVLDHGGPA